MRTTLDIDADVLELAKGLANGHKMSVGRVVSDLARRGAETPIRLIEKNRVYVIPSEKGGGPFGPGDLRAFLEGEFRGRAASFRPAKTRLSKRNRVGRRAGTK